MAIKKHDIPILEYDDNPEAMIKANRRQLYSFPKKAIFPFLLDEIDNFAKLNNCEQIGEFLSASKNYPIYKIVYLGEEVCMCLAPVGAAAAVQLLEFLIGYGVTEVIATGSCGALVDIPENTFLTPVEALRCEGTSYHYVAPSRTIKLNPKAINAIQKVMSKNNIPSMLCKTWTTDGFYRETKDLVDYRRTEGFSVVEMECSALAACAQFRNIIFGQILFTADTLANLEAHVDRDWGMKSFPLALRLCLEAVIELN